MNALRTLHPLMKTKGFRELCYGEHNFTKSTFDTVVKESIDLFQLSLQNENWTEFSNSCGSMVAFVDAFPEYVQEFQPIIVQLISIVKDKTDLVRKNAAVLLAKLAKDDQNNDFIRANHGFDVLMSLRSTF